MNTLKTYNLILLISYYFSLQAFAEDHCPKNSPADYANKTIKNFNFAACPKNSLVGANFKNAMLAGSSFADVNLTNADFSDSKLGPSESFPAVNFKSALLKKTIFTQAEMPATDFQFATFHCTDFSQANLLQVKFGPLQNFIKDSSCRTSFKNAELSIN